MLALAAIHQNTYVILIFFTSVGLIIYQNTFDVFCLTQLSVVIWQSLSAICFVPLWRKAVSEECFGSCLEGGAECEIREGIAAQPFSDSPPCKYGADSGAGAVQNL